MRHHNANRKLGRKKNQRNALLKSMARSLIIHEKITTTEAKAKELRPYVEKLITKGSTPVLAHKKLDALTTKYKDRKGGYTRITKLPRRMSDASKMASIELV